MTSARDKVVKIETLEAAGVHFGQGTVFNPEKNSSTDNKFLALQSAPACLESGMHIICNLSLYDQVINYNIIFINNNILRICSGLASSQSQTLSQF